MSGEIGDSIGALLLLGAVARDLGEADMNATVIEDRIDHDLRPEFRAVLAIAPALRFEAALAEGSRQSLGRQPSPAIGLAIELGKVGPDDLLRLVALEPLRTGVPAHHMPFGVEHVDRIVGHPANQKPEIVVARLLAFRQHEPSLVLPPQQQEDDSQDQWRQKYDDMQRIRPDEFIQGSPVRTKDERIQGEREDREQSAEQDPEDRVIAGGSRGIRHC